MRDMPPLNSLKAFEAAGRHLNFRLAADDLGVTQGAVAQHVRALETLLKLKLFERHACGPGSFITEMMVLQNHAMLRGL